MCVSSCFCMTQSEAIANDWHLFREVSHLFCKGVEEKGKEWRIKIKTMAQWINLWITIQRIIFEGFLFSDISKRPCSLKINSWWCLSTKKFLIVIILQNILTSKIKPPKLMFRQLYENFWFEFYALYGSRFVN